MVKECNKELNTRVDVGGAGELVFQADFDHASHTAGLHGVSVFVSWEKKHGYGGVIDLKDVDILIEDLTKWRENYVKSDEYRQLYVEGNTIWDVFKPKDYPLRLSKKGEYLAGSGVIDETD